jgi:hypothetical protein
VLAIGNWSFRCFSHFDIVIGGRGRLSSILSLLGFLRLFSLLCLGHSGSFVNSMRNATPRNSERDAWVNAKVRDQRYDIRNDAIKLLDIETIPDKVEILSKDLMDAVHIGTQNF